MPVWVRVRAIRPFFRLRDGAGRIFDQGRTFKGVTVLVVKGCNARKTVGVADDPLSLVKNGYGFPRLHLHGVKMVAKKVGIDMEQMNMAFGSGDYLAGNPGKPVRV